MVLICVVGIAGPAAAALPPATRYDPVARQVLSPAAFDPAVIVSLANIVYLLVLVLWFHSRIPEKRTRRLVLAFFIVSAVFTPALASDITARSEGGVISSLPDRLAFFPLYIAALSIAVFALALPYLARERRAPRAAADQREELAARCGLTSREGEIVSLVADGMSNKEIAFELGISSRTVGNHVFNLYRKLGINSRFELMGLMK
jgi:DNA-binding CsgD family transcriptional regulator